MGQQWSLPPSALLPWLRPLTRTPLGWYRRSLAGLRAQNAAAGRAPFALSRATYAYLFLLDEASMMHHWNGWTGASGATAAITSAMGSPRGTAGVAPSADALQVFAALLLCNTAVPLSARLDAALSLFLWPVEGAGGAQPQALSLDELAIVVALVGAGLARATGAAPPLPAQRAQLALQLYAAATAQPLQQRNDAGLLQPARLDLLVHPLALLRVCAAQTDWALYLDTITTAPYEAAVVAPVLSSPAPRINSSTSAFSSPVRSSGRGSAFSPVSAAVTPVPFSAATAVAIRSPSSVASPPPAPFSPDRPGNFHRSALLGSFMGAGPSPADRRRLRQALLDEQAREREQRQRDEAAAAAAAAASAAAAAAVAAATAAMASMPFAAPSLLACYASSSFSSASAATTAFSPPSRRHVLFDGSSAEQCQYEPFFSPSTAAAADSVSPSALCAPSSPATAVAAAPQQHASFGSSTARGMLPPPSFAAMPAVEPQSLQHAPPPAVAPVTTAAGPSQSLVEATSAPAAAIPAAEAVPVPEPSQAPATSPQQHDFVSGQTTGAAMEHHPSRQASPPLPGNTQPERTSSPRPALPAAAAPSVAAAAAAVLPTPAEPAPAPAATLAAAVAQPASTSNTPASATDAPPKPSGVDAVADEAVLAVAPVALQPKSQLAVPDGASAVDVAAAASATTSATAAPAAVASAAAPLPPMAPAVHRSLSARAPSPSQSEEGLFGKKKHVAPTAVNARAFPVARRPGSVSPLPPPSATASPAMLPVTASGSAHAAPPSASLATMTRPASKSLSLPQLPPLTRRARQQAAPPLPPKLRRRTHSQAEPPRPTPDSSGAEPYPPRSSSTAPSSSSSSLGAVPEIAASESEHGPSPIAPAASAAPGVPVSSASAGLLASVASTAVATTAGAVADVATPTEPHTPVSLSSSSSTVLLRPTPQRSADAPSQSAHAPPASAAMPATAAVATAAPALLDPLLLATPSGALAALAPLNSHVRGDSLTNVVAQLADASRLRTQQRRQRWASMGGDAGAIMAAKANAASGAASPAAAASRTSPVGFGSSASAATVAAVQPIAAPAPPSRADTVQQTPAAPSADAPSVFVTPAPTITVEPAREASPLAPFPFAQAHVLSAHAPVAPVAQGLSATMVQPTRPHAAAAAPFAPLAVNGVVHPTPSSVAVAEGPVLSLAHQAAPPAPVVNVAPPAVAASAPLNPLAAPATLTSSSQSAPVSLAEPFVALRPLSPLSAISDALLPQGVVLLPLAAPVQPSAVPLVVVAPAVSAAPVVPLEPAAATIGAVSPSMLSVPADSRRHVSPSPTFGYGGSSDARASPVSHSGRGGSFLGGGAFDGDGDGDDAERDAEEALKELELDWD